MQKSPEAEPIMTPLCKGGSKFSKTPAFEPHVTPGFARLNPGILRKGQLNRHTRYRPATTTRNTATQRSCQSRWTGILRKGQLNRHTRYRPATTTRNTATQRSCHSGILRKGLLNGHTKKLTKKPKKGGAVRAARARARVVRDAASRQTNRSRHRRLVGALTQARRARCCEWSRCCGWGGVPHASTAR